MPTPRTDWLDTLRDSLYRAETGLVSPRDRGVYRQARVDLCKRPRIAVVPSVIHVDDQEKPSVIELTFFSTITAEKLTSVSVKRVGCRMVSAHEPCRGSWRVLAVNNTLAPECSYIPDPWHPSEAYGC